MMTRVATFIPLSGIHIDKRSKIPLYRQLYQEIQALILNAQIKPGTQLPPTRVLSKELSLSRSTVLEAIDQLIAEGYLYAEVGRGTFVSDALKEIDLHEHRAIPTQPHQIDPIKISQRGAGLISQQAPIPESPLPFIPGIPDLAQFPLKLWGRLYAQQLKRAATHLGYRDGFGYGPLRESIADYLKQSRRVQCRPEQIIMTGGTQQALYIVTQLLTDPGDTAWIENPGYIGAKTAFKAAGIHPIPIPVDQDGLDVSYGIQTAPDAKLAYITPSHQYPAGGTLPISRRVQLLDWAAESKGIILEDDYDSEFRYVGHPLPSLQGLDTAQRVIYLGTFSKVMFPGLRLAYIVVPEHLAERFASARYNIDRGSNIVTQMALDQFIREGHYARHIRRMRQLYSARQRHLVEAITTTCADWLEISPSPAGLHLVGWLPKGVDDKTISKEMKTVGVIVPPVSDYSLTPLARGGLLFGYAAQDEHNISIAIKAIQEQWDKLGYHNNYL